MPRFPDSLGDWGKKARGHFVRTANWNPLGCRSSSDRAIGGKDDMRLRNGVDYTRVIERVDVPDTAYGSPLRGDDGIEDAVHLVSANRIENEQHLGRPARPISGRDDVDWQPAVGLTGYVDEGRGRDSRAARHGVHWHGDGGHDKGGNHRARCARWRAIR